MANDSGLFRTADDLEADGAEFDGWSWQRDTQQWLPLYEAKMFSYWQDRHGTYESYDLTDGKGVRAIPTPTDSQLDDPDYGIRARYWVDAAVVDDAVSDRWNRDWLLGWRDIATSLDVRTFVTSVLPRSAAGDPVLLAFPASPRQGPLLQAVWSTFAFDYIARQKLSGTHMKYFVTKQLACPAPATFDADPGWAGETLAEFVGPRVLELTYTSYRIKPYALDVIGRDPGEPFRWSPERRAQLTAELDAAMLHVYDIDRDDAEHVLDSFPVLRRYEERDHGEFRTKRLVLTEYDAMAKAAATGEPYRSPLDPPPGHGPRHSPRFQ